MNEELGLPSVNSGEAEASPFLLVQGVERVRLMAVCLVLLGERERTILLRHYMDDVPLRRIAAELGVTVQTVSRAHRRALAALRELLAGVDVHSSLDI